MAEDLVEGPVAEHLDVAGGEVLGVGEEFVEIVVAQLPAAGDGFGFDKLSGSASITRGEAITDDIRIKGPAAEVEMDGKVDLSEETYNLHVTVIPSLGLVAPVVDIATMIVNKEQEGPITANEYSIAGTWEDPIVTKLR